MKQVKLFDISNTKSLEKEVNLWLEEHQNNNIVDIKMISDGNGYTKTMIIYED